MSFFLLALALGSGPGGWTGPDPGGVTGPDPGAGPRWYTGLDTGSGPQAGHCGSRITFLLLTSLIMVRF